MPFALPEVAGGRNWGIVFDTNVPDRVSDETFVFGEAYEVTGRSSVMFVLNPGSRAAAAARAPDAKVTAV